MNNIVEIKNLTKTYEKGKTIALDDISLTIPPGISLSITGPSGRGNPHS